MSWSGGVYTKGNAGSGGWAGDAAAGIGIEAGRHDTQDNDFATGINQCLNKDGSNAATGNLNLNSNKITNLANASASGDAMAYGQIRNGTPLYLDTANNRLGIGTTTPIAPLDIAKSLSGIDLAVTKYESGAQGAILHLRKSKNDTIGNNTIVTNGDALGEVYFMGANGSGYTVGASIVAQIDGTPGASNDMPGRLIFSTTPDGSGSTVERMRIANGGNVGIGQSAPNNKLHVGDGSAATGIYLQGSTSGTSGGSVLLMPQGSLGNVSAIDGGAYNAGMKLRAYAGGITLTADSGGFAVTGLAGSTGGSYMKWNTSNGQWFYDTSSIRYKENIRDSQLGLETVKALRPRQYNYIYDGAPEDVGFIAEEVEPILPFLVAKNANNECESITYDRLTSVLVKAVQELCDQIEALEARIAALES